MILIVSNLVPQKNIFRKNPSLDLKQVIRTVVHANIQNKVHGENIFTAEKICKYRNLSLLLNHSRWAQNFHMWGPDVTGFICI